MSEPQHPADVITLPTSKGREEKGLCEGAEKGVIVQRVLFKWRSSGRRKRSTPS